MLAVGGVRFTLVLGKVVLFAAGAVRTGVQGLAIGCDLQGGVEGGEGGVLGPGGSS